MSKQKRCRVRGALAAAVAVAVPAVCARGQTNTWTVGGTRNWSDPSAWTGGLVPVSGATTGLLFNVGSNAAGFSANNNLANPFELSNLWVSARTQGPLAITGAPLRFVPNGTSQVWLSFDTAGSSATNLSGLRVNNDIVLDAPVRFVGFGAPLEVNGSISGAGGLTFYGADVRLNGANRDFSGPVDFYAGTLTLGPKATLGSSHVNLRSAVSQELRLVVPSATNIASGDHSVVIGAGAFLQFQNLTTAAADKIAGESEGVLVVAPDTVSSGVSLPSYARLGVMHPATGGVVTFSGSLQVTGGAYRFGGNAEWTGANDSGYDFDRVDTLNIASTLYGNSVNIGAGGGLAGGKVKLSAMYNSYAGGTVVEYNPRPNPDSPGIPYLTIDYTPAAGARPLGTGPVTIAGGLLFEGTAGALGSLENEIVFQPGSRLVFDSVRVGHTSSGGTTYAPAVNADRWPDARPIALDGTELLQRFLGNGAVKSLVEKVGAVSYGGGSRVALESFFGGGTNALAVDALTRAGRGTLVIAPQSSSVFGRGQQVRVPASGVAVDPVTGMVHPSVVVAPNGASPTFARVDGAGVLQSYTMRTSFDPASDAEVARTGTTLAANESVWALSSMGMTIPAGRTLTIRSGGLIFDNAFENSIVGGGAVAFANNGAPVEALVYSPDNHSNGVMTPVTASGLTKFGGGYLTLGAANPNLSGLVSVNEGRLILGADGALPIGVGLHVGRKAFAYLNGRSVSLTQLSGLGYVTPGSVTFGGSGLATVSVATSVDQEFGGILYDDPGRGAVLSLEKTGPRVLRLTGSASYGGTTTVREGTLYLAESGGGTGAFRVDAGATVDFRTSHTVGAIDGGGNTFAGTGSTVVIVTADRVRQRVLNLRSGAQMLLRPDGTAAGVSRVNTLAMATSTKLDLADNALLIDYAATAPSPEQSVRNWIAVTANSNRPWVVPGLTSSSAVAHPLGMVLGYATVGEVTGAGPGEPVDYLGQSVDDSTLVVRLALPGDTDLNGRVDFADLVHLAQNYGAGEGDRTWFAGDFTYDGVVDFADLVRLAQHYNTALPASVPGAAAGFEGELAAAFAAVPEPSVGGVLMAAAAGLVGRRRRKR